MARTRRPPEQARSLILDAAAAEFLAQGMEGFRVAEVARQAGVSRPLVSHYFGSREALLEAVVDRLMLTIHAAVLERVRNRSASEARAHLPHDLLAALHDVLQVHARLVVMLMLAGRAARLVEPITMMAHVIHASRVADTGPAPFEDTLLMVLTQTYTLLTHAVSDNLLSLAAPSLGSADQAGTALRTWMGERAEAHVEQRVGALFSGRTE
jgi:AcrR family transcriptional regulator